MHNLFLLNYNNYYNRLIKKLNTLDDYLLADPDYYKIESVNFLSTDEVNANAIINVVDLAFNMNNYNYMISQREDSTEFDRWFITKIENVRGCQFKLILRRDLISENWDNLNASALLINKGYCDISNPQFFNKEPISVTEMPINQTYLKDSSGVSWLVAYLPKIAFDVGTETTTTIVDGETVTTTTHWYDKSVEFQSSTLTPDYTMSIAEMNALIGYDKSVIGNEDVYLNYNLYNTKYTMDKMRMNLFTKTIKFVSNPSLFSDSVYITAGDSFKGSYVRMLESLVSDLGNKFMSVYSYNNILSKYNHRIIQVGNDYYQINISLTAGSEQSGDLSNSSNTTLYLNSSYGGVLHTSSSNFFSYNYIPSKINIYYSPIQTTPGSFYYKTTRNNTNGGSYDCIAVPYKDEFGNGATVNGLYHDPETMMCFMSQLSASWGTEVVYDVQCLPYRPTINTTNPVLDVDYGYIWKSGTKTPMGYVYYVKDVNRTFNIDLPIESSNNKADYLTKHYKLIGGNYNSSFDLKVYENNGIDYFNVDMTLLPYNPWIKINPNFKYLNGKDFNDATGLVLSGNFSISMLTNSFAEYQYNNSNYEAIFNAQMDYTEYQQKMNMIGSTISGVANAVGTGIGVAKLMGGPLGIASGVLSAGAGIADLAVQNKINNKQNEYTKQQYELNLGNIKSKPTTLSKVTALNINTKMFPYIEEYGCTDIEYEQVSKYLEFNGMSIGTVGDLETYLNPNYYFSAQVIRFKDITCNNYILGEINNELQQGFYIESEVN